MPHADWKVLADIAARAPPALLTWLAEPGLLTARVREFCGDDMRFRMLGPLRRAALPEALRARLTVTDSECLVREIEFRCDDTRIIFAQTIFPATTVAAFPWLRQLGEAPLGEALRRAGQPLTRDPLEYSQLPAGHALAEAASGTADGDGSPDDRSLVVASEPLWARRAVYRLAGHPILVQEVFLPALLRGAPA